MARPRKTGLDYFPFDVDFFSDEKVVCIGGEFGIKGELTTIKLLCAIYRNGYFTLWNESLKFKLKRELDGVSGELLEKIVQGLVRRGFFDESLFNSDSVLTSEGIQRRYFEATRLRERDPALPYLLGFHVGNHRKTGVSSLETGVSSLETRQKKRNKIKRSTDVDPKKTPPPFDEKFFLDEFFSEKGDDEKSRKWWAALETVRMALGLADMAAMRALGAEVMAEWELRKHRPSDWNDAALHMLSTLRKKSAGKTGSTSQEKGGPRHQGGRDAGKRSRMVQEEAARERDRMERNRSYEEMRRDAVRPADLIRSYGYDPEKVTILQATDPEWRARNPASGPLGLHEEEEG